MNRHCHHGDILARLERLEQQAAQLNESAVIIQFYDDDGRIHLSPGFDGRAFADEAEAAAALSKYKDITIIIIDV